MYVNCFVFLGSILALAAVPTPNLPSLPTVISENSLVRKKVSTQKYKVTLRFGDDNKTYNSEGIRFLPDVSNVELGEGTRDTDLSILRDHIEVMISRGVSRLALKLEEALVSEHAQTNTLFSPLSIAAALSLVRIGARGKTSQELAEVLGLGTATVPEIVHTSYGHLVSHFENLEGVTSPETTVASAIFLQQGYPVKESFLYLGRQVYRSEVLNVDFARNNVEATNSINNWVELKTSGHLKNFLSSPVSSTTRVLVANALYFNGEWEHPFPLETTQIRPFYIQHDDNPQNLEILQVKMMTNIAELPIVQDAKLNCRMVELPYKGGQVSMFVLQSLDPSIRAMRDLEQALSANVLEGLISSMKEMAVIVSIPRMHLEATVSLRDTLEVLGVHDLFDPLRADLGGISSLNPTMESLISANSTAFEATYPRVGEKADNVTMFENENTFSENQTSTSRNERYARDVSDNPGLYVDEVIHKVEMDITETGTVAAAATVVSITRDGSRKVIRFDRPFILFVRHQKTGFVMFYGSVIRPSDVPAL